MFDSWLPPAPHEIEVSIFGRGSGESIVVHVGGGVWVVADSLENESGSVPLQYLRALGVDVASQVALVIATHWHDDHIRGLAALYDEAKQASCCFPSTFLADEFRQFASQFSGRGIGKVTSGVRELGRILEILNARDWQTIKFGNAWKTLYRAPGSQMPHGHDVEIEALSPSDFDQVEFLRAVSSIALAENVATQAPHYDRNDVSCAVQIRFGDMSIILAADLEKTHSKSGWDAVFASGLLKGPAAGLIKVPHHGSKTGHHDKIWDTLCAPNPIATLTQWTRGSGRLPQPEDIQRIMNLSGEAYAATRSLTSGDRHRLQAVNSVLRRTKSKIRNLDNRLGHVRHRWIDGVWATDLMGQAVPLNQAAA